MDGNKSFFIPNEIELEREEVQKALFSWKATRHKTVLQVEGARQVGKTHEVRKFAYANYKQVIYVNLVRDEFGFEDALSNRDFMEQYCATAGLGVFQDNEETILIIDEIQERAEVYNAIRDLRSWLSCDIIVSGSYLARTANSRDFFLPAGIAYLKISPLSFREFCKALGFAEIYDGVDFYGGSEGSSYEKLQEAYGVYRRIGGYPAVVTTYLRSRDVDVCLDVLEDLVRTFTDESSRFFSNSTALSIFQETYKSVFMQMANEKKGTGKGCMEFITDFVKDSVKEPVSRNEVRQAAAWLMYSGIIGYCDLYNNGDVRDIIENRRAYFADNGIAYYVSTLGTVPNEAVEGLLTENFAYTELSRLYTRPASRRLLKGKKPCFSICGDYELDFVCVDREDCITGIEVKSSNNRARSLAYYKDKGLIDRGIRAFPTTGGHGERFDSVPIYLIAREDLYREEQ